MGHFRHPAVVREAAADHKDRAAQRDGREFGQVGPGAAQARELAPRRRGATDASESDGTESDDELELLVPHTPTSGTREKKGGAFDDFRLG